MIDFSTIQGLSIPEGAVVQIERNGVVLWALQTGVPILIDVKKVKATTYAAETTYSNESFVLLDIYPRTNGKVKVTYGGLTKTITDTSGAAVPNAQRCFFGTFNGVSDDVETPESGTLKIEGDCAAFGCGTYSTAAKTSEATYWLGVTSIQSLGEVDFIPDNAFASKISGCTGIKSAVIPPSAKRIGTYAFLGTALQSAIVSDGVEEIGGSAFASCASLRDMQIPATVKKIATESGAANPFWGCPLPPIVAAGNTAYKVDGNCLVEIATQRLVSGFSGAAIPAGVSAVGNYAFYKANGVADIVIPDGATRLEQSAFSECSLTSITIPASMTYIGDSAIAFCRNLTQVTFLGTTPPSFGSSPISSGSGYALSKIVVPKGCSAAYKAVSALSSVSSLIVEAS